ncbi:hypothetical protein HZH68_003369 [Vespula germanica]|uniref:Uncharacterized protein n=2 Tax=Vespula TaxID=7451 RepID=A0A834NP09_VESGE|nr:hypothetical protein HZH68_003369 [Vespula germanica]
MLAGCLVDRVYVVHEDVLAESSEMYKRMILAIVREKPCLVTSQWNQPVSSMDSSSRTGLPLSPSIEDILRLELYLPYAPLPGGGEILPAVSTGAASGGCRPVLLGGIDLSMSAAVEPVPTLPTLPTSGLPAHNPLHHPPGGLALPPLASASVMMPRPPPGTTMPPLGPSSLPQAHQDTGDLADTPPNPDVLLALLARNKNLEDLSCCDYKNSKTYN